MALGVVIGLSGCALEQAPSTPTATTSAEDTVTESSGGSTGEDALQGTWQLRTDYLRAAGSDAELQKVPTLTFDDGSLGVNTGCNTGGGDYQVSGDQLTIGPVALTMRACEGATGDLERLVSSLLGAGELTFAVEGDSLRLTAEDGTTLAFSAGEAGVGDGASDATGTATTSRPTATGQTGNSGSTATETQTQRAKQSDKPKTSDGAKKTDRAKKTDSARTTDKAKRSGAGKTSGGTG